MMEKCRAIRCDLPANWHIWNPVSNFDSFLCEEHMNSVQWQLVTQGRQGVESINFYKENLKRVKKK